MNARAPARLTDVREQVVDDLPQRVAISDERHPGEVTVDRTAGLDRSPPQVVRAGGDLVAPHATVIRG